MKILLFLCILLTTSKAEETRSETSIREAEELSFKENEHGSVSKTKDESTQHCNCQTVLKPSSCAELMLEGYTRSGVYKIYPRKWFRQGPIKVYCDMETDGGGWTVFQRRDDILPRENFTRNWDDYKRGFGNLTGEFWLGNDYLHVLTNQDHVTLRVDLEDFEGYKRHATYSRFEVANWTNQFKLIAEDYTGNAGDSLIYKYDPNMTSFTFFTHDRDNGCAKLYKGGWWYTGCHASNPNGLYLAGPHESYADGIEWVTWKGHHYSLKFTEMKIRPTYFIHCAED